MPILAGIAVDGGDNLAWLTEAEFENHRLGGTETAAFALALDPGAVLSGLTWSNQIGWRQSTSLRSDPENQYRRQSREVPPHFPQECLRPPFGGIASRAGSTNVYDLAFGGLNSGGVTRLEDSWGIPRSD